MNVDFVDGVRQLIDFVGQRPKGSCVGGLVLLDGVRQMHEVVQL
jgi:hypothetical protein